MQHIMKSPALSLLAAGAAGAFAVLMAPVFLRTSTAGPSLLPFQGRLTDAAGNAVSDGGRVVEFKMYDAPTGGSVKWAGEVHKLSVNGGLVNTMLGSKASLSAVDFAQPTFLQVTVDANNDGQITAADPPLLPRQSVVGSVFAAEAGNSRQLNGHPAAEYEAVFDGANPATGLLNGARLKTGTVTGPALAPGSVGASQIIPGAVGASQIADGTITAQDLSTSLQQGVTPVGSIVAYIGDTAPPGWLLCDGTIQTTNSFPALAQVVGNKFGAGTATTFKLPDLRGMFLRGRNGLRTGILSDPFAAVSGNSGQDGKRFAPVAGGATGDNVGACQLDWVGDHAHSAGELAALVHISSNENVYSKERTVPSWAATAASNGAAVPLQTNVEDGAEVVGETGPITGNRPAAVNPASDTRPQNMAVNYIIKH